MNFTVCAGRPSYRVLPRECAISEFKGVPLCFVFGLFSSDNLFVPNSRLYNWIYTETLRYCFKLMVWEWLFPPSRVRFYSIFDSNWGKKSGIQVIDLWPALSTGRVRKTCFKTLEISCICYEGSILSLKVIKIHPVLRADEFTGSKNTHNADFANMWLKQAFQSYFSSIGRWHPHSIALYFPSWFV